jgi:bacterioferritin
MLQSVPREFLEPAQEEQQRAGQLAERIVQLGAEPEFSLVGLAERTPAHTMWRGRIWWT